MLHQLELEAIAQAQTGFHFTTVELVPDLRHPNGTKLFGAASWRWDCVGVLQPRIQLDTDQQGYGMLQTLLHECRHILRGDHGHLQPATIDEIRTDVIATLREMHPDGSEKFERNLNNHLERTAGPLLEETEEAEADCDTWADAKLAAAREAGGTLGGAISYLVENGFELEAAE